MKKINVHIVPHSHWDREWYFTLEDSSVMLIEQMEFLVTSLETNDKFKHFILDGQMAMIDDLEELCPAIIDRFKKLVNEKRIIIGPWYSQCDTQVIKFESVIRNMETGIESASAIGEHMKVGYLPDCFGQHAYLPSMFKQLGLKYSIFQRGVLNEQVKDSLNFVWESPNKEFINTTNIYNGYGVAKFLSHDKSYLFDYLMPVLDEKKDLELLLPAGGDQYPIQLKFVEECEEINRMQDKYNFIMSSYEKYLDNSKFDNVIKGELISCQKSRIHRTMHSQRMDIKIINNELEKKIIEQYEPLQAIYNLATGETINDNINKIIWKRLAVIHGHDGICSCNSDATNEDVKARLIALDRYVDAKINVLKKKIALKLNVGMDEIILFSYNFNNKITGEYKIITEEPDFLLSMDDKKIEYYIESQKYVNGGYKVVLTKKGESKVANKGYYETIVSFNNLKCDLGYKIIKIEANKSSSIEKSVINLNDYYMDNKIDLSGNILGFELSTDDGDSYDYAFVENEKSLIYFTPENIITYENKISYETKIINHKGIENTIKTTITVGEDYKIEHKFVNNMKDTRIRQVILTKDSNCSSLVDIGLGIIERPNINIEELNLWKEGKMCELPLPIYPFERGITSNGITITNTNCMEYEVNENNVLLTMIRSVGVLGKDDLTTRPGRASGINNAVVYTPKAQMLDVDINIEFVISNKKINKSYFDNAQTSDIYQIQSLDIFSNRIDRFILPITAHKIENVNIDFSMNEVYTSAIYVKEGKVVIRLFNPTTKQQVVDFKKDLYIGNMDLKNLTKVTDVTLNPNEYITVVLNN